MSTSSDSSSYDVQVIPARVHLAVQITVRKKKSRHRRSRGRSRRASRRSSRHRRRRQSASNGRSRSSATSPAGGPPPPDPAADSKVSATHEAGASEDAQADECAQDPCGSGLATGALPSDRPTAGKDESPHSPSGSSTEPTADEAPCATPVASGAPSAEDGPSTQDTVRQPKLEAAVDRVVGVEAALRGLRELVGEDTGASMRAPAVRLAQVRAEFFGSKLHCIARLSRCFFQPTSARRFFFLRLEEPTNAPKALGSQWLEARIETHELYAHI